MRPAQLLTVLDREFLSAREGHHTPVMLWGPPGIGKSQIIAQVARRHAAPMIDIRLSQMEPTDLRGIPFRIENRVEWAVPSMLPDTERHGPYGILFLDEITSAPPSVSAAAYQLILDRRLGDYEVPAGWAIFAAGNRQGDRGVTYTMPAPLANRFSHFEVETNIDDWVSWAYANNMDDRLIGSCASVPSCCLISIRRTIRWPFPARARGNSRIARCKNSVTTPSCCCRRCNPASALLPGWNCTPLSRISTTCPTWTRSCAANQWLCRAKWTCSMRLRRHWLAARYAPKGQPMRK